MGGVKTLKWCADSAPGLDSPQAIFDYLDAHSYQEGNYTVSEAFTVMRGDEVVATKAYKSDNYWDYVDDNDYYQIWRDGVYCGSYD